MFVGKAGMFYQSADGVATEKLLRRASIPSLVLEKMIEHEVILNTSQSRASLLSCVLKMVFKH